MHFYIFNKSSLKPGYFEDNELKNEIKKDVDRTY